MKTRSKGTSEWVRGIVAGLVMVLALATVSAAHEKPTTTQAATVSEPPTAAKAKEQPKGGMGEGIKVHGHWTIDIKNPDGTLASHNEFENALDQNGPGALAGILGRVYVAGTWMIRLSSDVSSIENGPCSLPSGESNDCLIDEPNGQYLGPYVSKNLTLTVPMGGAGMPAGTVQLSGSTTATHSVAIKNVHTNLSSASGTTFRFTSKTLDGPIILPLVGQIIQVTVVFSFSS